MASHGDIDIEYLRGWIGREEHAVDTVDLRLARQFAATFDDDPDTIREGDEAPIGIHWCLHLPLPRTTELGPDGTMPVGGFMPPVPLPRRMRAGGACRFLAPLPVGARIERRSYISDIAVKDGSTGRMVFVTVVNELSSGGALLVEDRVDSVFRGEAASPAYARESPKDTSEATGDAGEKLEISAAMMLRYSALTFNAHRIHFDETYARGTEGYAGLLVHGPLQATYLLRAAARKLDRTPRVFEFRARSPLVLDHPASISVRDGADALELAICDHAGQITASATARG